MSHRPLLVHAAQVNVARNSGMGRIAWHWLEAFRDRGWDTWHIGPEETQRPLHRTLWPRLALGALSKSGRQPTVVLAHEPVADVFRQAGLRTVLFSHGIESRGNLLIPRGRKRRGIREMVFGVFWRRYQIAADRALGGCPLLLLSNEEDRRHALGRWGRRHEDIFVFRNGIDNGIRREECAAATSEVPVGLFFASWVLRKGTDTLVEAALELHRTGVAMRWIVAGTGQTAEAVLRDWPNELHGSVEVVPCVDAEMEQEIYRRASIFVLPSYFEGQPLTLLQAMAHGLCCITTDNCGQRDVIVHGKNGLLFEAGSVQQLVRHLSGCVHSRDLRFELGMAASESVANRNWKDVSGEIVDKIEDWIANPPPG